MRPLVIGLSLAGVALLGWSISRRSSSSTSATPRPPDLSPERQAVLDEAIGQLGTLYQWGGGHGAGGYGVDCSGLVIEAHRRAGQRLPPCPMPTSNGWWHCLEHVAIPEPGDLALYGPGDRAIHVEMVVSFDGEHAETIGAQGGDRDVATEQIAIERNAHVRYATTHGRANFLGFVRNPIEAQAARHGLVEALLAPLPLQGDEA